MNTLSFKHSSCRAAAHTTHLHSSPKVPKVNVHSDQKYHTGASSCYLVLFSLANYALLNCCYDFFVYKHPVHDWWLLFHFPLQEVPSSGTLLPLSHLTSLHVIQLTYFSDQTHYKITLPSKSRFFQVVLFLQDAPPELNFQFENHTL